MQRPAITRITGYHPGLAERPSGRRRVLLADRGTFAGGRETPIIDAEVQMDTAGFTKEQHSRDGPGEAATLRLSDTVGLVRLADVVADHRPTAMAPGTLLLDAGSGHAPGVTAFVGDR